MSCMPPTESPELEAEVHQTMLDREKIQFRYRALSIHRDRRPMLIQWLYSLARNLGLGWSSRAAAVAYLDRCLDAFPDVPIEGLTLLAMACLLVGAKMEEEEIRIPTVSGMIEVSGTPALPEELNVMETLVLKVWQWNAYVITPHHLIPFYSRVASIFDPVMDPALVASLTSWLPEKGCVDEILSDPLCQLACTIAEMAMRHEATIQFLPSVIACSAVALSRVCLKITPHWPEALGVVVGVPGQATEPPIVLACCAQLLRVCEIPVASLDHAAIQNAVAESVPAAQAAPQGTDFGGIGVSPALGNSTEQQRVSLSYESYPGTRSDAMDGVSELEPQNAKTSMNHHGPGDGATLGAIGSGFNSRPIYNPTPSFA